MIGEKVEKQLKRDAVAYKAGFADGYRVAKAEQIHCRECAAFNGMNCVRNNMIAVRTDDYCSRAERKEE